MDFIDLDRVLDEFEAKEDLYSSTTIQVKPVAQSVVQNGERRKEEQIEPTSSLGRHQKHESTSSQDDEVRPKENRIEDHSVVSEPCLVDLTETTLSAPVLEPSVFWNGVGRELAPLIPSTEAVASEESGPKTSAPPPDVTSNASDAIDQEPEDPKLSPPTGSLEVQLILDQQQHPPPDVVAGHVITGSGSSTPSPMPTLKRPVGFFDKEEGPGDHVTEEELERYLSELEEKIGEPDPSESTEHDDQHNRSAPSSEELKSYLENLEKISGEALAISCDSATQPQLEDEREGTNEAVVSEETIKADVIEATVPAAVEPTVEPSNSIPEDSTDEVTPGNELPPVSVAPLPHTEEHEVVLDRQENRPKFSHEVALDEEDIDEDPYVLLAFPSAHGPGDTAGSGDDNVQQSLKAEIEQALLASSSSAENSSVGPIKTAEKVKANGESSELQVAAIESSSDSFEVCSAPHSTAPAPTVTAITEGLRNDISEEEKENLTSDAPAQAEEAKEEASAQQYTESSKAIEQPAQTSAAGTSADDNAKPPEPAASTGATASKGQLVTIRHLDASPSSDREKTIGGAPMKLTESELQLGRVPPVWIPDNDSLVCMLCESKFTLIRRRHHCRACGRVLCNICCNQRTKLPYMTSSQQQGTSGDAGKQRNQDARVCNSCFERLKRIEEYEKQTTNDAQGNEAAQSANPQAAADQGGSTAASTSTAAAVVAPSPPPRPPVLKREGSTVRRSEPKQVMFSDGIKPGGDLTETPPSSVTTPSQPATPTTVAGVTSKGGLPSLVGKGSSTKGIRARELECFFTLPGAATTSDHAAGALKWPPMVNEKGELIHADDEGVVAAFAEKLEKNDQSKTVTFALKRNLRVQVRLTHTDCCLHRTVWCFATDGLRNVSQDELLIVIERSTDTESSKAESTPPLDAFVYFNVLYDEALKGKPLGDLSYAVFSQSEMHPVDATKGYFGSKDNAGFLHFRPTYQCLQNLCLPEQPFLVGVLIQKSEVSWAKVMPLRLLLRSGVEYRYYPYPLLSDRSRKTLFYETGHTIMNLLTDMRNFTYTLPAISGCTIALEDDKTVILIPVDQYNQVLKILQSSNEHVLAWAASLHKSADAHLVCVQQPDTLSYTSQTINRENHGRKITGACFVVFNASLKAGGASSRISIVEDGLMIQIRPEAMERLRQSLHHQQAFDLIPATSGGEKPSPDANANVEIRWIPVPEKMSRYVLRSRINGRNLTDAPRYRLHGKTVESTNGRKLVRLIELYLLRDDDESGGSPGEPDDLQSMVRQVASACGNALLPFVEILDDANMKTIAVRFAMGADLVEYSVGSNEQPLADPVMAAVDDVLIPLLHSRAMGGGGNGNDGNPRVWRVELIMRLLDL